MPGMEGLDAVLTGPSAMQAVYGDDGGSEARGVSPKAGGGMTGVGPPCHECAGDGVVPSGSHGYGYADDEWRDARWSVCGSCGGTGVAGDRDPLGWGRRRPERTSDE